MTRLRIAGVLATGALVIVLVALFARPARLTPAAGPPGDLTIVTTTPILYSLTAQIVGNVATVANLVPPGASPENYALRPQDADTLHRADVLVINGLGFEQFLERAIEEAQSRRVVVMTASTDVETIGQPPDPHIWLDPLRAAQMTEVIARGLADADPAHAPVYQANAAAARARFERLDHDTRALLATVPDRRFIAFHPAWTYFAERYGLEQVAAIEETPGAEPTARDIAKLVRLVKDSGVRTLFSEPQFSPKIVEVLARDLGLTVHEVNPEGGELSADGYDALMRQNVAIFVTALQETAGPRR